MKLLFTSTFNIHYSIFDIFMSREVRPQTGLKVQFE